MNSQTDQQLLRDYAGLRSEAAFAELVHRHVDLVYSAALRMVRDAHLAEDVTQSVFVALAQNARQLIDRPVLSGWLHRTAHNLASNIIRSEVRRRAREQEAAAMNELFSPEPDAHWEQIGPQLDAALGELAEPDRDALLLRYFERKSAREMAQIFGTSEDAAQKRVNRAVDRLREVFAKRGVTVGASGLVAIISANAIQAAPIGLTAAISTAVTIAGTAGPTSTAIAATKIIAMTTLQKTLITATIVAAVGVGIYEFREAATLRDKVQSLQQQQEQQATLNEQIRQLQRERDAATNRAAALVTENANLKKNPSEVLRLRGEVGRLRQENATVAASSALNKITANPETWKVMRDQQKMGMTAIYKELAKRLNLAPEVAEKFNDLLADHVMDNVDQITEALRDKKSDAQINQVFASQETALQEKLKDLIGPDGISQYQEYTKNLCSTLTSEQFKGMLTGDDAAKQEKTKQLYRAMLEETQAALSSAGLPSDYQTVPMLNFGNIVSEAQGEQSLKLLDGIYDRVATRLSTLLSPEEQEKFKEFRAAALRNNRTALTMNRTLMAPLAK